MRALILGLLLATQGLGGEQASPSEQPTACMVIGRKEYAPPNSTLSRPIEWTNAYGFLIKWRAEETPEFFIYRQTSPSIRHPATLDEFLSGLGEIPDGSTLDWVNTCCCPISSGMPKDARTKLEETVKAHGFSLLQTGEGATLICTCESTNVVWYTREGTREVRTATGVLAHCPFDVRTAQAWYGHNFTVGGMPVRPTDAVPESELLKHVGKTVSVSGVWNPGVVWKPSAEERNMQMPVNPNKDSPVIRGDGIMVEKLEVFKE